VPYIKQEYRKEIEPYLTALIGAVQRKDGITNWGMYNYITYKLMLSIPHDRYEIMQGVIGLLESVKNEYYARVVGPHEKKKINQNGDVQ